METKATLKRQFLAWYIDFLCVSVLTFSIAYFLGALDWFRGYAVYVPAVILAMLGKLAPQFSLGRKFLSIDLNGIVDPRIVSRETFVLMFLATVLALDGTKQLVRWIDLSPFPLFGWQPEGISQVVVAFVLGSASILASYWLFKLNRRGLWLSLTIIAFWSLNILLSWNATNDAVARRTIEKRALQGIPIRNGEIEFMQLVLNPSLLIVATLCLIVLLKYRGRFS